MVAFGTQTGWDRTGWDGTGQDGTGQDKVVCPTFGTTGLDRTKLSVLRLVRWTGQDKTIKMTKLPFIYYPQPTYLCFP